jgi:hypothetical protein
MVTMQISVSLVGLLRDTNGGSPVDATVKNLAALRDEGFRRVWMAQMPGAPAPDVYIAALGPQMLRLPGGALWER